MAYSIRTTSIALSLLVAVGLIAGAFVVSNPPASVSAEDTEEILKAYAAKDTDKDGLPDWQESLYKTDPNNPESVQKGMKDGEAVEAGLVKPQFESENAAQEPSDPKVPGEAPTAGSLTEQFSRVLLESVVSQSGGKPLREADQQALVTFLLKDLSEKIADVLKSKYTITSISQSPTVDVLTYIGSVEKTFLAYQVPADSTDFLSLAQAFVEQGEDSAEPKLLALARMYHNLAEANIRLTAPTSLAAAHLEMIRSFDTLSKVILATARYKEDPLPVMGALALYRSTATEMFNAMTVLSSAIRANGAGTGTDVGSMIVFYAGGTTQP